MKILFAWSGLTGYMGDCWRALSKMPDIDLRIAVDLADRHYGGNFDAADVMRNLSWSANLPCAWNPDVVFSVGWHNRLCREAALSFGAASKVCCFDMPWEWKFRKFAARFVLARFLRNFDAAFVPGSVAARYARWLGFPAERIHHGLFATDIKRFSAHKGGGGFLFVGRDCWEKGTDVIRKAHAIYKRRGGTWPLKVVCGVRPAEVPAFFSKADCFVLASRCEPWGVVLAEACAASLPIICTDRCGARFELVGRNGIVVRHGSANAFAEAMMSVSQGAVVLDGDCGKMLAAPYSCERWANRVVDICRGLING